MKRIFTIGQLIVLTVFLLSLGSCVNEVKKQAGNPPIDTNYLHSLTKINIAFSGRVVYYGNSISSSARADTELVTLMPVDQDQGISDFPILLQWNGNSFTFKEDTSYSNVHIDSSGGYHSSLEQYHVLRNIFGKISADGKTLDSLSDFFTDDVYINEMHIYDKHSITTNMQVYNLPQIISTNDTLIFSFEGDSLSRKINLLSNKINGSDAGQNSINDSLQTILWDSGNPTLRVSFFK